MTSHQQAIAANIALFKADVYDNQESVFIRSNLCSRMALTLDLSVPIKRKTLEESAPLIGDPSKPNCGLSDSDFPDAKSFPSLYPNSAFKPGMKLLDFACGTGIVTQKYLPYIGVAGEVVGIDINPDFLSKFNQRAEKTTTQVVGYNYDILDPSKSEELNARFGNYFDTAICTLSYHHIHDYRDVTKRIVDFLKPGAWLIIVDFYNEDVERQQNVSANSAVQHMGGLKVDSLIDTLQNHANLTNVSAAREFRFNVWERREFIVNHSTQSVIDKLESGQLEEKLEHDEPVYLIEQSVIIAMGQKKLQ